MLVNKKAGNKMEKILKQKESGIYNGKRIGVIGAGAFGTAIADLLSEHHQVSLGVREESKLDDNTSLMKYMQANQQNPKVFNGCRLNKNLSVVPDYEAAVDKEILIIILPVKYLRAAVGDLNKKITEKMGTSIHKDTIIISGMKGIEADTAKSPTQILAEMLPEIDKKNFAVIAGATFAREIYERHNLSATIAAANKATAATLAQTLSVSDQLNLHPSTDIIGTEVLGALKNIVAIGSGYLAESQKSEGARHTFIGKAFIEAQKLVVFFGGRRSSCFGEAGFPDFMMTANADMSRNYSAGVHLAKHGKIAYDSDKGTAEGVNTSIAIYKLFDKMGPEFAQKHFKIFYEMYHVMHNGKSPEDCFRDILSHYSADPELSKFRESLEMMRYRFRR
jgi:glycerol-3-phosphate dehydrogenase